MRSSIGKNDLWIAAVTRVLRGVLLTTDRNFVHLHGNHIQVEYIDSKALQRGII